MDADHDESYSNSERSVQHRVKGRSVDRHAILEVVAAVRIAISQ